MSAGLAMPGRSTAPSSWIDRIEAGLGQLIEIPAALAVAAEIGGVALAIDAKDARAAAWYKRFGAVPLLDDPVKLVLPLATIAQAITK